MKKSKKVLISLLATLVVGGSFSIPAFAAETSAQNVSLEATQNQEAKIVSQQTIKLPLTASNMTQHEKIVTVYDNGVKKTTTLIVHNLPSFARSATQTAEATCYEDVERGSSGVIARFELTGRFEYNVDAQTVRKIGSSKNYTILDPSKYALGKYTEYSQSGGGGLWWKPWANVKADYNVYLKGGAGLFANNGTLEVKCDSDGHIELK